MSIAETAQILGLSKENVKTRTSRARLQMRDLLAPGWGGSWTKKSASGRAAFQKTS
jgi:RNA polymerase sigma-70 factor, ECF subfamily